ncbi:hypothetical protein GUJ93_ZPchr0012g21298 [Zizania palustris]|uniref:Uncharacterized protein n=1 Tax=Zizania palustris TaxID=103762 RepID=A0A8J5WRM6_ZIZPA|nr:hypothetical protein GUJ93_ZPchr0012g21298 [Zizania palustris]
MRDAAVALSRRCVTDCRRRARRAATSGVQCEDASRFSQQQRSFCAGPIVARRKNTAARKAAEAAREKSTAGDEDFHRATDLQIGMQVLVNLSVLAISPLLEISGLPSRHIMREQLRSGSEVLRHLRTQASEEQKFEAKKTSLLLQPTKIYSAKSVQAPHTGCIEQASHFTLRKSGQPSEDFDQVLGNSNWCWASYTKVYTHTNRQH